MGERKEGRKQGTASCSASVFLKQRAELNSLFQKERGKTASAARILSLNPTRRPLPCLLIQSFFYASVPSNCFSLPPPVPALPSTFSSSPFFVPPPRVPILSSLHPSHSPISSLSISFLPSLFSSVVDPDPHGSGTFAWIQIRIRNYSSGSGSSKN